MRIIGMMVVGGGEADRYLEASLKEMRRLTDDALICCNNTDPATEAMIEKYRYQWYRDDREWGIYQPQLKESLVERLQALRPDWILAFDSDEVFDKQLTRERLERLAERGQLAWYFFVIDLWNSPHEHQEGLGFWNIRFFKNMPAYGFKYEAKHLHCGIAPLWAYQYGKWAPYLLKHYGLMKPEDRARKVLRYDKYDPKAVYKGRVYYDWLRSKKSPEAFDEDEWHRKVEEEVATYKYSDKNEKSMFAREKKFVFMQREDGSVVDIPESQSLETQKRHPDWKVLRTEDSSQVQNKLTERMLEIVQDPLECGLCEFVGKNELSLKMHKAKAHT